VKLLRVPLFELLSFLSFSLYFCSFRVNLFSLGDSGSEDVPLEGRTLPPLGFRVSPWTFSFSFHGVPFFLVFCCFFPHVFFLFDSFFFPSPMREIYPSSLEAVRDSRVNFSTGRFCDLFTIFSIRKFGPLFNWLTFYCWVAQRFLLGKTFGFSFDQSGAVWSSLFSWLDSRRGPIYPLFLS